MNRQKTIDFLIKNGFDKQEPGSYANSVCNVVIEADLLIIADNNGNEYFAMSFFEAVGYMILIGFITDVVV